MNRLLLAGLSALALAVSAVPGSADTITYNTGLAGPSGTFYGVGDPNTSWTVNTTSNGVELGLQATEPFIDPITPYLDNYVAPVGLSPGHSPRVAWSLAFSFDGVSATGGPITIGELSALNLTVQDVLHSTTETVNLLLLPDNVGWAGAGPATAATPSDTAVQNSENLGFPGVPALIAPLYDPWEADTFNITLDAVCGSSACGGSGLDLGSVNVAVDTVPEPISIALLGSGLLGLWVVRRRSRMRAGPTGAHEAVS